MTYSTIKPVNSGTETQKTGKRSLDVSTGDSLWGEALKENRWAQLAELIFVFSPAMIVVIILGFIPTEDPLWPTVAISIAYVAMFGLIWLGITLRGEQWHSIGLHFKRPSVSQVGFTFLKSVPVFVFAVAAFIFGSILMANIVGIPQQADMTEYNYLQGNLPALLGSLACVYLTASFGEEVVFRGFLITRLQILFGGQTRMAMIFAVTLSSILFGFAHYGWGAMGIGQTACMGAALAVSFFLFKRNLWVVILAHGYMDTILLTQQYFATGTVGG